MFEALASTGGTPTASSAGNTMKLPPPASEFSDAAKKAGDEEEEIGHAVLASLSADRKANAFV